MALPPASAVIVSVAFAGRSVLIWAASSGAEGPAAKASRESFPTATLKGSVRLVTNNFPPFTNQTSKVSLRPLEEGLLLGDPEGLTEGDWPGVGLAAPGGEPSDAAPLFTQAAARRPTPRTTMPSRFIEFLSLEGLSPHGRYLGQPPLRRRVTVLSQGE